MNRISQTQIALYKLKTALASPSLLISEFCTELKNQVDIASEIYFTELNDEKSTHENQALLINEIEKFEDKCLKSMPESFLEIDVAINESIKSLETVLNSNLKIPDERQISELNKEITRIYSTIKNACFMGQSIIFLKRDYEVFERYNFEIPFLGVMFVIEDMFIDNRHFKRYDL